MSLFFGIICNEKKCPPSISLDIFPNKKDSKFKKINKINEIHISYSENINRVSLQEYFNENILINLEGRVDNFKSLNENFFSNIAVNEAHLILLLYLKFGDKFALYLNGAFSICIRDIKKNRTLLVRDHLGLRPFYYFKKNGMISYASDPKFILKALKLSTSFNEKKILTYITKLSQDTANQTYYDLIESVPPRSVLILEGEQIKNIEYFNFQLEKNKVSDASLINEFEEIFTNVISEQIGDKLTFATALSGGLDSSSITCAAAKIAKKNNKKISAYTAIFSELNKEDEHKTNETKFSKLVAKHSETSHRIIAIKKIDVIKNILNSQQNLTEPNYHGNQYIDKSIFNKLNQDNIDIYLSGYDGDSIVSYGYQKIHKFIRQAKIKSAYFEYIQLKKKRMQHGNYYSFFRDYLFTNIASNQLLQIYYQLKNKFPIDSSSWFLRKDLSKIEKNKVKESYVSSVKDLKNFHLNTFNSEIWQHSLELFNLNSSKFKIDVRYPFLDKRVMQFCLNVPDSLKLKNGLDRYILRAALKDLIPDEIYNRTTKSDLSPYYNYSYNKNFHLMKTAILESSDFLENIIDIDKIRKFSIDEKDETKKIIFQHIAVLSKWLKCN